MASAVQEVSNEGYPKVATHWEAFKEWLLPSTAFARSETPKKDLKFGRVMIALFYLGLTGLFIYTVMRLLYSGRIELFSSLYKVDYVEAPSLVFCPFNPNAEIDWPAAAAPWVTARKSDLQGSHNLNVSARNCSFDRACACVDMGAYHLSDSARETDPGGSADKMVFREGIEIRSNFSDPSGDHVLKVGIYDNYDTAPDWFYVNQGSMFIGQLELIIWTVVDISIQGLVNTFKGDLRAMVKNRHIYRYTSQEVGDTRLSHETSIRYEMKTFFVEETMSSHRAFSLYTVGVIGALVALRWVVVDAFFLLMFPAWKPEEAKLEPTVRELSSTSLWVRNLLFCFGEDAEPGESEPLLEGKGSQA